MYYKIVNNKKIMATILVDFDGTCVKHDFPRIGEEIGAAPVLKRLVDSGHNLILFTMRSSKDEGCHNADKGDLTPKKFDTDVLLDAVNWFKKHDIELYGIQTNPTQHTWTTSPKAYGHLIIDDTALGAPLLYCERTRKKYIDWEKVEEYLELNNYF
jgi:hypothetical protein